MSDKTIFDMFMVAANHAMDRYQGISEIERGMVAIEFLNGIHQSCVFLSRWDGEVSPQRLDKVLSEGLKAIGLTVGIAIKRSDPQAG